LIEVLFAVNDSDPDGFVSEVWYITWTPPGKPMRLTSAVSLVESIRIGTTTEDPPGTNMTFETGKKTEIGFGVTTPPPPPPPHPIMQAMEQIMRKWRGIEAVRHRRKRWLYS